MSRVKGEDIDILDGKNESEPKDSKKPENPIKLTLVYTYKKQKSQKTEDTIKIND